MTSPLKRPVKLALIQLATGDNKTTNLLRASEKVAEAAKGGAKIIVLPVRHKYPTFMRREKLIVNVNLKKECFNSPYGTEHFKNYAECIPSGSETSLEPSQTPSYDALRTLAAKHEIYLIGGSIPEVDPSTSKLYNTSMAFSPTGQLLAKHRKVHLFDIDIPGKIRFIESESLSAGSSLTLVETEYGIIGLGLCYDVRFPELAMISARKGSFLMVYPGAFNMTTGPMHWELLARARAVDNQVYVALCSPARNTEGKGYVAWGHSSVVDPNAEVVATTDEREGIVECELSPERIAEARSGIPITQQRRFDVYADVSVVEPSQPREQE